MMRSGPGKRCVVLMNQSAPDHTLLEVRPSPGPGRRAVSHQSSRDKRAKRSLPGSTVRREGRAISERIVLAYSGGLDTSVAIGQIAEETGAEVIAVAADVGQGGEDLETIRQRALGCGAAEAVVLDLRDEFAERYCLPALQAHAL